MSSTDDDDDEPEIGFTTHGLTVAQLSTMAISLTSVGVDGCTALPPGPRDCFASPDGRDDPSSSTDDEDDVVPAMLALKDSSICS
jgi:hypothetical protein